MTLSNSPPCVYRECWSVAAHPRRNEAFVWRALSFGALSPLGFRLLAPGFWNACLGLLCAWEP